MESARGLRSVLGVLVVASLLGACGALGAGSAPPHGGQGVDDDSIKVGAWQPKSGRFTVYSEITAGAKAYFHMINEQGGIEGREIDYVTRDDQYDPAMTVTVARRLVEDDRVFAIVAAIGTPTNAAVLDYMESVGIPNVAPIASGDLFASRLRANWFPMLPPDSRGAALVTEFAVDQLGLDTVAVMYQNDDLGKPALEAVRATLAKRALEPVAEVGFPADEVDYTAEIERVRESGADAVVAWGGTPVVAGLQRAASAIGYQPTWLAHVSAATPAFFELGGQDGTYFPTYITPLPSDVDEARQFEAALAVVAPDVQPGTLAEEGWVAASIFVEGVRRALAHGELTWDSLIAALESFDTFDTDLASGIWYSAWAHTGISQQIIVQARGERLVPVTEPRE